MARITLQGQGDGAQITERITKEVLSSFQEGELKHSVIRTVGSVTIQILTYMKFFFRVGRFLEMTVVITESEGSIMVDALSGRGTSWGADENFISIVADALSELDFKIIEQE